MGLLLEVAGQHLPRQLFGIAVEGLEAGQLVLELRDDPRIGRIVVNVVDLERILLEVVELPGVDVVVEADELVLPADQGLALRVLPGDGLALGAVSRLSGGPLRLVQALGRLSHLEIVVEDHMPGDGHLLLGRGPRPGRVVVEQERRPSPSEGRCHSPRAGGARSRRSSPDCSTRPAPCMNDLLFLLNEEPRRIGVLFPDFLDEFGRLISIALVRSPHPYAFPRAIQRCPVNGLQHLKPLQARHLNIEKKKDPTSSS